MTEEIRQELREDIVEKKNEMLHLIDKDVNNIEEIFDSMQEEILEKYNNDEIIAHLTEDNRRIKEMNYKKIFCHNHFCDILIGLTVILLPISLTISSRYLQICE